MPKQKSKLLENKTNAQLLEALEKLLSPLQEAYIIDKLFSSEQHSHLTNKLIANRLFQKIKNYHTSQNNNSNLATYLFDNNSQPTIEISSKHFAAAVFQVLSEEEEEKPIFKKENSDEEYTIEKEIFKELLENIKQSNNSLDQLANTKINDILQNTIELFDLAEVSSALTIKNPLQLNKTNPLDQAFSKSKTPPTNSFTTTQSPEIAPSTPISPISSEKSYTSEALNTENEQSNLPPNPNNLYNKLQHLKDKFSNIHQPNTHQRMPKENDDNKPKTKSLLNKLKRTKYQDMTEDHPVPTSTVKSDQLTTINEFYNQRINKSSNKIETNPGSSLLYLKRQKNNSTLAEWDEKHIKCYILDKEPKSSWLPSSSNNNKQLLSEQHKLFIDFLERAAAQYPDPKALATVETNNFSPTDLQVLINALNKQNPSILVKLQLPEELNKCSYLIKSNTNQAETKNMTQQEYDKATKLINKYNSKIEEQIKKITSNKPKT